MGLQWDRENLTGLHREVFRPTDRAIVTVCDRSGKHLGVVFTSVAEMRARGKVQSLFASDPDYYIHKIQDASGGRPARAIVSIDRNSTTSS